MKTVKGERTVWKAGKMRAWIYNEDKEILNVSYGNGTQLATFGYNCFQVWFNKAVRDKQKRRQKRRSSLDFTPKGED